MKKLNPHNLCLYSLSLKCNFNCITKTWKKAWLYFTQFSEEWELVLFEHSIPKFTLKKEKSSSFYAPNIANTTQFCMWLFNAKWRTNAHYLALVSFVNPTHYLVEQYFAFSLQSKMLKIPLHIWLQFTIGAYLNQRTHTQNIYF